MRRSYFYHAQADHALRLADITIQQNVEEILRHVAEELDRLADDAGSGEADFGNPENRSAVTPGGSTQKMYTKRYKENRRI